MSNEEILKDLKQNMVKSKSDIMKKYGVDEENALIIYKEYRKLLYKDLMGNYKRNISDKLALGYGSKYQLLRMLGWHRNYFNLCVSGVLDCASDIDWLDFDFNGPEDKELLNADFLPGLKKEWESVWACTSQVGINWDAIGVTSDGTYILLEAKAHIDEVKGNTTHSKDPRILNSIQKLIYKYNLKADINDWLVDNYQLANRLVFLDFLHEHGIKAKFLYVFFINGYVFNTTPIIESRKDWDDVLNHELTSMGIKGSELEKEVNVLYLDCNPQ